VELGDGDVSKGSWRAADAHHGAAFLDPAELAWEFLRRNPDYQAAFTAHPRTTDRGTAGPARRWGLRFLADPRQAADEAVVFWHPEELASVIILAPAPTRFGLEPFVVDDWLMRLPRRSGDDGTHVLLKDGKVRYQILLTTPPKNGAARHAVVPLDVTTPRRAHATHEFWDYAARGHPRPRFVGASRIERLNMALRALDLRSSGASYRDVAQALFGPQAADGAPWKTAAVRDTVIRLVRTGLFMMRGGYARLLGPFRADPSPRSRSP